MKGKNVLDMLRDLLNKIENLPESERMSPDESVKKEEKKLGEAGSLVQQLFTIRNRLYERAVSNLHVIMEKKDGREHSYKEFLKFDTLHDIVDGLLWWQVREEFNQYEQEYNVGIRNGFIVVKFIKEESTESGGTCLLESMQNMRRFLEDLKSINRRIDKKVEGEEFNFEDFPKDSFFIMGDKIDPKKPH